MYEEIIQLVGEKKGPTSIVLAGVHGNEKCGVEAFKNVLPSLKIESGKVLFIYGNPRAIESNQRFTEANLNRMFKDDNLLSEKEKNSYEYKRVQFLKTYLNQADALLDIHASNTLDSNPFIICEPNAKGIVKYLPIDRVVSGFDKIEPGGTDYYMNNLGKIGICVECGYLGNPKSVRIAEESIFSFLMARGHITNDITPKKQSHMHMYNLYLTKTNNFILSKLFDDFENISKGQILGVDGTTEIRAEKDGIILFARNRNKTGDEAFLFGENRDNITS